MANTQISTIPSILPARDFDLEHRLIELSDVFDPSHYIRQAGSESNKDPILHYLTQGWLLGLEPNASFAGTLMRPYFESVGFNQPPALTWLLLSATGPHLPAARVEIEALANQIRESGLFDEESYLRRSGCGEFGLDAAVHYLLVGERAGFQPCQEFDPAYYLARYPDLAKLNSLFSHYTRYGKNEGRFGAPLQTGRSGLRANDPAKDNVLLVVHETSRTGAPILGWNIGRILAGMYNVFVVHLGGGDLTQHFEELSVEIYGPFKDARRTSLDIAYSLSHLLEYRRYAYAIVNSAESRQVIEPFVRKFIPTLMLTHEFASYVLPATSIQEGFDWATEIVFPARIVAQAAEKVHPELRARKTHILPQGISLLPPIETTQTSLSASEEKSWKTLAHLTQQHDANGLFIVLGAGHVHLRKGVDLFLSAATTVMKSQPDRRIHFLWVGDGFNPKEDASYSVYLGDQMNRAGIAANVTFVSAVTDLEPVYRIADVFFLSSRLDPLPNVSIDAAIRGIPHICFKDANGMAELMLDNPDTAIGVVDYLDAEAAGRLVLNLAADSNLLERLGRGVKLLAERTFDMRNYVLQIDALGTAAAAKMKHRQDDLATLVADTTFDQAMFLRHKTVMESRRSTIAQHLALVAAHGWNNPRTEAFLRRPAPGFNPYIYAAHSSRLLPECDPLADFVRQGKPPGPWQKKVLSPNDASQTPKPAGRLRVALHAHFFYPDLAHDLLMRLEANASPCDLLISTDQASKAQQLKDTLCNYAGGKVTVKVVPNKGRDIGPLLTEFRQDLAAYDLIGHVHGKKSLIVDDPAMGSLWREFLWQNLIGRLHPMLDLIVSAFEEDAALGLVFPSDWPLTGWTDNYDEASMIAARMGWKDPLPDHVDFPIGTMFWARREAIMPLLNLGLDWDDYPAEPLPYDGTILHALERLWPLVCESAGFTVAQTHIPGVSR